MVVVESTLLVTIDKPHIKSASLTNVKKNIVVKICATSAVMSYRLDFIARASLLKTA